ncbi:hypothetical protein ECEC1849_1597, partial [Escherichia coli EC1849]
NCIRR